MYQVAEGKRCVIYIRVSSERQIKGFSLDGQKHYLSEWAKRQGMTVAKIYVEEGKSGKSIQGCRFVKHIGRRTLRGKASQGASWGSCWSDGCGW